MSDFDDLPPRPRKQDHGLGGSLGRVAGGFLWPAVFFAAAAIIIYLLIR
jgi:hypothetical protein